MIDGAREIYKRFYLACMLMATDWNVVDVFVLHKDDDFVILCDSFLTFSLFFRIFIKFYTLY